MLQQKSLGDLKMLLTATKEKLGEVANKLVDMMLNFDSTDAAEKNRLMFSR